MLTLALTTILAAPAEARTERITMSSPSWVPPLIRRLAVCETGGNPRHNWRNTYGGIVGWYVGTWQLDRYPGMPKYPWNATLKQQVKVAVRSVYVKHRYYGCLHGPEHAWVRG